MASSEHERPPEAHGGLPPAYGPSTVRLGLIFYGVMGCAAIIWRMGFYGESILYPSPEAREAAWSLRSAAIAGGVLGLVALAFSEWMTRTTRMGEALARALGEGLRGLSIPDALLLALASGLAEEMLFRGALQPRVGLLIASALFGAAHLIPRRDLIPWTGFAFLMGLLLGGLYQWTGTLVAPVVAHTLINAVNLPRLARRVEDESSGRDRSGTPRA